MASMIPSSPSFRERFASGRLRAIDVLSIAVAGTAGCALGLFALDAVVASTSSVRAEAHAPAPAAELFTGRDLGTYVGTWVSDAGTHLIVAKSGAVWADAGGLIGSARLDPRDRTHLLFEGASFRCSYRIAAEKPGAEKPDALVWGLVDGTPGTACPKGRYTRRFLL